MLLQLLFHFTARQHFVTKIRIADFVVITQPKRTLVVERHRAKLIIGIGTT
jgi:hypothetical protein